MYHNIQFKFSFFKVRKINMKMSVCAIAIKGFYDITRSMKKASSQDFNIIFYGQSHTSFT